MPRRPVWHHAASRAALAIILAFALLPGGGGVSRYGSLLGLAALQQAPNTAAPGTTTDTYQTWITTTGPVAPTGTTTSFAWSKKSNIYHDSRCRFVANISPANLQTGTTPPPGKTLHKDCPK